MATLLTLGGLAKSFREHICDARAEIYVNKTFSDQSDSVVGAPSPEDFLFMLSPMFVVPLEPEDPEKELPTTLPPIHEVDEEIRMAWVLGCRRFVLEHFGDEVEIPDKMIDPYWAMSLAQRAWQAYGQKHTPATTWTRHPDGDENLFWVDDMCEYTWTSIDPIHRHAWRAATQACVRLVERGMTSKKSGRRPDINLYQMAEVESGLDEACERPIGTLLLSRARRKSEGTDYWEFFAREDTTITMLTYDEMDVISFQSVGLGSMAGQSLHRAFLRVNVDVPIDTLQRIRWDFNCSYLDMETDEDVYAMLNIGRAEPGESHPLVEHLRTQVDKLIEKAPKLLTPRIEIGRFS